MLRIRSADIRSSAGKNVSKSPVRTVSDVDGGAEHHMVVEKKL